MHWTVILATGLAIVASLGTAHAGSYGFGYQGNGNDPYAIVVVPQQYPAQGLLDIDFDKRFHEFDHTNEVPGERSCYGC